MEAQNLIKGLAGLSDLNSLGREKVDWKIPLSLEGAVYWTESFLCSAVPQRIFDVGSDNLKKR
jgi:hypothetical protein